MLIKVDAKQLEWRSAVFLSQDKVGIDEIHRGLDAHGDNQKRFSLPSRLIAKTFLFRLIYGGSAYAYTVDPDFDGIGNLAFWENVIEETYKKYDGLKGWHTFLMKTTAENNGRLPIPTGREFLFKQYPNFRGEMEWPRTQVLNYPVQGFSADLMTIARISAYTRISKMPEYKDGKIKFLNTVHDDIQLDIATEKELCYNICICLEKVFEDIPKNFERAFKKPFNVPMAGEVSYGRNLYDLIEFDKTKEIQLI